MTEREQVCFKFYNTTTSTVSTGTNLPFNNVDFNIGGSYDDVNYEYTFLKKGTYLIGLSFVKGTNNSAVRFFLNRGGTTTNIVTMTKGNLYSNSTVDGVIMYDFDVNDILYSRSLYGSPKMNKEVVPTGNIYNSWWGVRLSWRDV